MTREQEHLQKTAENDSKGNGSGEHKSDPEPERPYRGDFAIFEDQVQERLERLEQIEHELAVLGSRLPDQTASLEKEARTLREEIGDIEEYAGYGWS